MRLYAALFAVGLVVYGLVAWDRVLRPSPDPHFVYQADAWLHGRVAIDPPPPAGDDWAQVEAVVLDDGTTASGRRLITRPVFRTLGGDELPTARIRRSLGATAYVSFPPFPSVVMLPSAALAGRAGNDVIPTLVVAALILPLALLVLRRLAAAGLSIKRGPSRPLWTGKAGPFTPPRVASRDPASEPHEAGPPDPAPEPRTLRDELWLVATLAFGSVLWFAAVQGKVWYTAHVVGVALALVYAWASIEAERPVVAGLALGAAALTRTAMAFMVPLLVCEAWRVHGGLAAWRADRRAMLRALRRPVVRFAIPLAGFALAGMVYNLVRFGAPTEFGHSYLHVRQQAQIEQYGLASYHYLARNLAVAFTLLPELLPRAPFVQISGHGLALWFTTPVLVLVLWPRELGPLHRPLWLCVAAVALPSLVYQNSGWVQFGYRFSLDYLALLIMLLAVGGRPLTRTARALIVAGIAINLFGAITFDRAWQYYRVGGNSYDVIVAH